MWTLNFYKTLHKHILTQVPHSKSKYLNISNWTVQPLEFLILYHEPACWVSKALWLIQYYLFIICVYSFSWKEECHWHTFSLGQFSRHAYVKIMVRTVTLYVLCCIITGHVIVEGKNRNHKGRLTLSRVAEVGNNKSPSECG